jgi:hypothetical protein
MRKAFGVRTAQAATKEANPDGIARRVVRRSWPAFVAVSLLLVLVWSVVGCEAKVGPTKEMLIDEPLASAAVTEVRLVMGAGKLSLSPGAEGLVAGTVTYNVEDWRPKISRRDDRVVIQQGSTKEPTGDGVINQWDLELGRAPMRLAIEAGAYQSVLDLSGLSLQELDIEDGAAESQVVFSSVNPSQMERLRYRTGASAVSLSGLANANFAEMEFSGAAGTYSLDFSGQLRSDASAVIEVAAGSVQIEVPSTTRVELRFKATVADVATQGLWTIDGTTCRTPALIDEEGGKTLTIELEMAAGSATLICK